MAPMEPGLSTDVQAAHEAAFAEARELAAAGRLDEARERLLALREAIARPSATLELQLASVEQARGDLRAAIAACEAALAVDPRVCLAYRNLAALLSNAGRLGEARDVLRRGVAAVPRDVSLWLRLARLESALGDSAAALAAADTVESIGPSDAAAWCDVGRLRAEYWRWEEASRALDEAARRDPGAPAIETLRAVVKQETGDTDAALRGLAAARARDPGDLRAAVAEKLMLPQIYADPADAAHWRERYARGLAQLAQESPRWLARARDVFHLDHQNFLLAYQGEDDRELQRAYSSLLARLAAEVHPEWRAPRPATFDGARPLRIAFVSGIFRDCTAGRYFERWVTRLDARRFERFVYHTAPVEDDFTRRIAACVEHFETARIGCEELAARLAAQRLDAIVYPEVGMTPSTNLLAALRLAPLQCAGWGHPVTTGSDALDLYFTCGAMEPPHAAAHYVERPVPLPGLGVSYSMPSAPPPAERRHFRLPASGRLYMCPQSLFKVHPEMDAFFVDILEADPEAALVFFQAPARAVTLRFAERLQHALRARGIDAHGQLKFLPRMNGDAFRSALSLADVILDTVRWSGGNTSLDAFAAATPVVTVPGRFMRGRQTSAMLDLMGIAGLTAASREEYVRIALETARDRDRNAALREAIRANRAALFDRTEPLHAFAEALLEAAARN